jgi:UDP-3-O-[3-hydroxymyristoyl] glucosamine N-acyltransferase
VGHDTRIGCCSVINPGAHISGSVDIGDGVLIGAGAVVLQGVRVGDGASWRRGSRDERCPFRRNGGRGAGATKGLVT